MAKAIAKAKAQAKERGLLGNLPSKYRTHKKAGVQEPILVQYEDVEVEYDDETELFRFVGRSKCLPVRFWDNTPKEQSELVQDLAGIVRERAVNAYQEILTIDGKEHVDPDVLEFILYQCYCEESYSLEGLARPSISFLHKVIQVLRSKNLNLTFNDPTNNVDISELISTYIHLAAFALKPQTLEEEQIQIQYLKELIENPFFRTGKDQAQGVLLYKDIKSADLSLFNEEFVKEKTGWDDVPTICFNVESPSIRAIGKFLWSHSKNDILDKLKAEDLEGELDMSLVTKDNPNPKFSRIRKLLNTKKFQDYQKLLNIVQRAVVIARDYYDRSYTEILSTPALVKAQFSKENEWLNSEVSAGTPPQILTEFLKGLADELKPIIDQYYGRNIGLDGIEDILKVLLKQSFSQEDRLERYQKIEYLTSENHENSDLDDFARMNGVEGRRHL